MPGARSRIAAPRTASLPFISSEPTLSRPTVGLDAAPAPCARTRRPSARTAPGSRRRTRHWRRDRASRSRRAGVGKNEAIAGRSIPGSMPSPNFAIAISAPVLPAETTQSASPAADRVDGEPHRRVRRPARSATDGRTSSGHHLVGVMDDEMVLEPRQRCHHGLEAVLDAEQEKMRMGKALQRDARALASPSRARDRRPWRRARW